MPRWTAIDSSIGPHERFLVVIQMLVSLESVTTKTVRVERAKFTSHANSSRLCAPGNKASTDFPTDYGEVIGPV